MFCTSSYTLIPRTRTRTRSMQYEYEIREEKKGLYEVRVRLKCEFDCVVGIRHYNANNRKFIGNN